MEYIIDNISTLSTIESKYLNKLVQQADWCICDCLNEAFLGDRKEAEMNIGIGTLTLRVEGDNLKYIFVPSADLEKMIVNTIKEGKSPLVTGVEQSLVSHVVDSYQDMF